MNNNFVIMDCEKKYKEALERAKKWYNAPNVDKIPTFANRVIDEIFPELRESEDEKIKQKIIKLIKKSNEVGGYALHKWEADEMLAWLEKQGQEPRKVSIWKHWKDGICGNGEGKLIYLIKNGDDYSLSSSLGYECDYILLSDLDNLMVEKQGEQKPTDEDMVEALRTEYEKGRADAFAQMQKEWSDVDEYMLNETILHLKELIEIDKAHHLGCDVQYYQRDIDWLKLLKNRVQSQQEWSDEDKKMIGRIRSIIEAYAFSQSAVDVNGDLCEKKFIDVDIWLKSLKQRIGWKPSDEQITVLELASKYERVFTSKQIDILIDLKEQLKKLKE